MAFSPLGGSGLGGLFGALGGQNQGGTGGLFGNQNEGGFQFRPVIGLSSNLLSAAFSAQRAQAAVSSLSAADRAQFNQRPSRDPAVVTSLPESDPDQTLANRVRQARESENFIDLDDRRLNAVEGDSDRTATFALQIAFERLRALAELSAEESTTDSTRAQIESDFQRGLQEVQNYLATVETDLLSIQYGRRQSNVESTISLGRNETDFDASLLSGGADDIIEGLSGTEQFTISITKSGETDDILVDLSGISGDLTLTNVKDHINETIAALAQTDENGATVLDSEGVPVPKHQTRFDIRTSGSNAGLQIDGILTEQVSLSAVNAAPTVFVAGTADPVDEDQISTARVTELNNLSGSITNDNVIAFAGTNIDGTFLEQETASTFEEDPIDADIAARRDQFLSESLAAVQEANGTTDEDTSNDDDDDDTIAITDVNNSNRATAETTASSVAVDSAGNLFVVGTTTGAFGSQLNTATGEEVYLTKVDTEGNVVFSRFLGTSGDSEAYGVTIDSADSVIVTGQTDSPVTDGDLLDGNDAFVIKYDQFGTEQFRYQLDTFSTTSGLAVVTDSSNDIYVTGSASGAIGNGTSFGGVSDTFVLKLDGSSSTTAGTVLDRTLIGGSGRESGQAIAIAGDGDLLIAAEESDNLVLRKLSTSDLSQENASFDLGFLGSEGRIGGIAVDGNSVFVGGTTGSTSALTASGAITVGGDSAQAQDGFVAGFTTSTNSINANFVTRLGTGGTDNIVDIVASDGKVYAAGTTSDALTGETSVGASDGFVARFDATTGALEDQQQFGAAFQRYDVSGAAFTTQGDSVLSTLGLPAGIVSPDQERTLVNQTSAREGDHFFFEIGGRKTRIEIDPSDDFGDISRKIRVAAIGRVEVEVRDTGERGQRIEIKTIRGGEAITLERGANGEDALDRLGIAPGTYQPSDQLFTDVDDRFNQIGGTFGLGIENPLSISNRTFATYTLGELDTAIRNIGRAFRSLTPNPLAGLLQDPIPEGPVSARTTSQIANFQSALQRLQSSNPSTGVGLFA